MDVKLVKDGNGGYRTPDGRFTVSPVTMGDGPRNQGHKEWHLVDTTGRAKMGWNGRSEITLWRLYDVRDMIAHHLEREATS